MGRIVLVPCVIAGVHGPPEALQRRIELFDVMSVWFRLCRVTNYGFGGASRLIKLNLHRRIDFRSPASIRTYL